MTNTPYFKTQQEVMKYVADGGAVVNEYGIKIRFEDGSLNVGTSFATPSHWQPFHEPRLKTKVWRWEGVVEHTKGNRYLDQSSGLFSEEHAAKHYPGYTKVEGSEREI